MTFRTLVSAETVVEKLDDPTWVVVDCRHRLDDPAAGRVLYERSHIPGARFADLLHDLSGPPGGDGGRHPLPTAEAMRATFGALGIGPGMQVVAYDDMGGQYAARLWWMLRYMGHEAAAVLNGGWQRWRALRLPTGSGEERWEAESFISEPRPEMVASFEEVAAGEALLVDARASERYRGEVEPIDPVAGHIPGAINQPTAENLAADLTFHPPEALRAAWKPLVGEHAPEERIVYCGSGVTACHAILALEHAGLGGARLFPPSWSGWSADAKRPIERG